MKTLALETSAKSVSVAVTENGTIDFTKSPKELIELF